MNSSDNNHILAGRKLWIPRMSTGAAALMAAAFRSLGIDAHVSPRSDERTTALASRVTTGEECLPQRVVLGNFMKVLERPDFIPSEHAFFLPTSSGPCRFGQYAPFLRKLLNEWGYEEAIVFSPTSSNQYEGIADKATRFFRMAWRTFVISDLLRKATLMHRPYESDPGSTDALHADALNRIGAIFEDGDLSMHRQIRKLVRELQAIRRDFHAMPLSAPLKSRPLIGVVGEIFLRFNSFSNQEILRKIESTGGEAWIADISEWVWYTHWEVERKLRECKKRFSGEMLRAKVRGAVQHRDEMTLQSPFHDLFADRDELKIGQVLKYSEPYLPPQKALGEMTVNTGKTIAYYHAGCDGVVDISPFTCMNGIVTEAVYPKLSKDYDHFPIRIFYFDGVPFDLDGDLEIFMELVKSYRIRRLQQTF